MCVWKFQDAWLHNRHHSRTVLLKTWFIHMTSAAAVTAVRAAVLYVPMSSELLTLSFFTMANLTVIYLQHLIRSPLTVLRCGNLVSGIVPLMVVHMCASDLFK